MNERMTDERWNHLNASETVWTKREQAEVAGEVNALQIDVMEKDAQIKALADSGMAMIGALSLLASHDGHAADALASSAEALLSSLRLVGRLK